MTAKTYLRNISQPSTTRSQGKRSPWRRQKSSPWNPTSKVSLSTGGVLKGVTKKEIVDIIQSHLLDIFVAGMVLDEAWRSQKSVILWKTLLIYTLRQLLKEKLQFFSLSVKKINKNKSIWGLLLRCGQREAEAPAVQRGDGADGQDGQSSDGGRQPRAGSLHQCHTSGACQTHVQGNNASASSHASDTAGHKHSCKQIILAVVVCLFVSSAGMDALPGRLQRGASGLRRHRGGLAVSWRNPLRHQDRVHLLHTGTAVCFGGLVPVLLTWQRVDPKHCCYFASVTVGEGCVCAGSGQVHPAHSHLRHCRNEAEEHWHHQDPHHCGPHRWKLSGKLLAWGSLHFCHMKLPFVLARRNVLL